MIHKNGRHISLRTNYSLAKIDAQLLQSFLRDLLREASKSQEVTEDKLIEYTDTMVSSDLRKQTNKHPLELAWIWYKHCKRHRETEGSVLSPKQFL